MLLKDKIAVIYGGSGVIGSAVAQSFAREGAKVFLAGRTKEKLERIVKKLKESGAHAEFSLVDALKKEEVDNHHADIFSKERRIDISFNAIGVDHVQGIPLIELTEEQFHEPFHKYTLANFLTCTSAARYMVKNKSGVILTLSTPGGFMANGVAGGFSISNSAVESLTIKFAGELGGEGIRAICLRSHAIPETIEKGSSVKKMFMHRAQLIGISIEEMFEQMRQSTLLNRLPTLNDLSETATFMASDKANSITATVINLCGGTIIG